MRSDEGVWKRNGKKGWRDRNERKGARMVGKRDQRKERRKVGMNGESN